MVVANRRIAPDTRRAGRVPAAPEDLTERGRRTRRALVDAARQVFERDGFLPARITDIAETAGVAHGTFYTYFDTKESIFLEVITALQSELIIDPGAAHTHDPECPDEPQSPVAAIEAANRLYLGRYRANRTLMGIWEHMSTFSPEFAELVRTGRRAFAARSERSIRSLQARGLADENIDARYAAYALGGMVSRFAYSWSSQDEEFELEVAVQQLTLLWANAIGLEIAPGELDRLKSKAPVKPRARRATSR